MGSGHFKKSSPGAPRSRAPWRTYGALAGGAAPRVNHAEKRTFPPTGGQELMSFSRYATTSGLLQFRGPQRKETILPSFTM
jgi:hypothetical protein